MKKSLSEFPSYDINPITDVIGMRFLRWNAKKGDKDIVIHADNSQTVMDKFDMREYYQDLRDKTMVYDDMIPILTSLSSNGVRVLGYIFSHTLRGSDEVRLSPSDLMNYFSLKSKNRILDGIVELLDAGVIYRKASKDKLYFVNVNLIFRGGDKDKSDYMKIFMNK